jgi:hypothetical protein
MEKKVILEVEQRNGTVQAVVWSSHDGIKYPSLKGTKDSILASNYYFFLSWLKKPWALDRAFEYAHKWGCKKADELANDTRAEEAYERYRSRYGSTEAQTQIQN